MSDRKVETFCPICLEEPLVWRMNNGTLEYGNERAVLDYCFHAFCFSCIMIWSQQSVRVRPQYHEPSSTLDVDMNDSDEHDEDFQFQEVGNELKDDENLFDYSLSNSADDLNHVITVVEPISNNQSIISSYEKSRYVPVAHLVSNREYLCPLCKCPYRSILFNIISDVEYERFRLPVEVIHHHVRPDVGELPTTPRPVRLYRSTDFSSTESWRRAIYSRKLKPRNSQSLSYRRYISQTVSSESAFIRNDPHTLARLRPWIERELCVLLSERNDDVNIVLQYVLGVLREYGHSATDTARFLRTFLGEDSEIFVRELGHFARSPFNIVNYDRFTVYEADND